MCFVFKVERYCATGLTCRAPYPCCCHPASRHESPRESHRANYLRESYHLESYLRESYHLASYHHENYHLASCLPANYRPSNYRRHVNCLLVHCLHGKQWRRVQALPQLARVLPPLVPLQQLVQQPLPRLQRRHRTMTVLPHLSS